MRSNKPDFRSAPPKWATGLQFAIADSPNAIENLTPQQIAGLRGISPKYFIGEVNASGGFGLGIADTVAFANADIIVTLPSGDTLGVVDTDSDVASLTQHRSTLCDPSCSRAAAGSRFPPTRFRRFM